MDLHAVHQVVSPLLAARDGDREEILEFRDGDADQYDLVMKGAVVEIAKVRIAEGVDLFTALEFPQRLKCAVVQHVMKLDVQKGPAGAVVVDQQ